MKKLLIIFAASILGMVACNEERVESIKNFEKMSTIGNIPSNITVFRGRLVFPTLADYEQTLNMLDTSLANWDIYLNETYGHLSDDSASNLIDSLNVRFEQPLIDFMAAFPNFVSLNSVIESEVDTWLETDFPNGIDPYGHFVFERVEQAVLNPFSEVIIGNNGYKYVEDGLITAYGLTEFDSLITLDQICDFLDEIEQGVFEYADTNNTRTKNARAKRIFNFLGNGDKNDPNCPRRAIQRSEGFVTHAGGKHQIRWYLEIHTPLTGKCRAKAKTCNYATTRRGSWRKHFTHTESRVYGQTVDNSCNLYQFDSGIKSRKAFGLKATENTFTCKTKNRHVFGIHKGVVQLEKASELEW